MSTDLRVIEFARTEKVSFDLYSSYEIKVRVSVNLESDAVFKLVSTAFNNKGYRAVIPINETEVTIKVMFTHPGKNQDIKIIPISNCIAGKECTVKVDVIGERKDFNALTEPKDYNDRLTIPCNLCKIILKQTRSGRQINNFTIEKSAKNKLFHGELEKLLGIEENLSYELMSGLSRYNSAYYFHDLNKVPFKEYELLTTLKQIELEWDIEQKQKQKKFALVEECVRQKNYAFVISDNSVIQLTAGTREENTPNNLTEIQIAPQSGYFCKSHPFVTVREYKADSTPELGNVFSECSNNVKFNVYQCYSFTNFDKTIAASAGSENKLVEQIVRILKEFKNKYKTYNIYTIEISSCGFPDVIEHLEEKPVSTLISNIHVYPSDEYAFFFESLPKDKVNIKTMMHDRKKVRFYIEENPLPIIEEKKQWDNGPLNKVNPIENYSTYPNINVLNLSGANKENNTTVRTEKKFESIDDYYQCLKEKSSSEISATNATLYRNGKAYFDLGKYNTFAKYVSYLKQKLQTAFLNLISICYSQDYKLDFSVDVMNGIFLEKWGMKEYLDNTVFNWKKIVSSMDIFRYHFKSEFASFWGNREIFFKGIVSIFATGALTHIDDYEKTALDSSYRYYKKKNEGSLDICLYPVLYNDNAISADNVTKRGIEGEIERSFQIEENGGEIQYNIKFPGIAAKIEHKVPVFKTSVYEKPFVRDYIGGASIEKSMFSCFHFAPWISLQSDYETTYGKLFKLSNILKETIFYLYNIQNQVLNSRLWCGKNTVSELRALETWKANLKHPEFDVNGILVCTSPNEENAENHLSFENKQWSLFLDGINKEIITDIPSSPRLKSIYQYLKTCSGNFILEKYEDLNIGQDIFNSILIIMTITDFIETKQVKLLSMMDSMELEYKNLIELSNEEQLKESADSYNEMEKSAKSKFDSLCKELDIFGAKNAFNSLETGDIKNLLSRLNFASNIDFGNLEKFCSSISFVSELLESCVNSRTYWLTGINRPMKVKPIF